MTEIKIKVRPIEDRIIVVPEIRKEVMTEAGIIIPESQERPQIGTILAVGPGKQNLYDGKDIPMQLKKGEFVMFGKYTGTMIKLKNKNEDEVTMLMMRQGDVIAVLDKQDIEAAIKV